MDIEEVLVASGIAVMGALCLVVMVMLFVVLPVELYTQKKCLDAGYPKSSVAWNLQGYCLNVDGSVQGVVHKLD